MRLNIEEKNSDDIIYSSESHLTLVKIMLSDIFFYRIKDSINIIKLVNGDAKKQQPSSLIRINVIVNVLYWHAKKQPSEKHVH